MAYNDRPQGGFDRKMFQGDWKCSKCQADIKELPFEPDPGRLDQLLCKECHRQKVQTFKRDGSRFGR